MRAGLQGAAFNVYRALCASGVLCIANEGHSTHCLMGVGMGWPLLALALHACAQVCMEQ